MKKIQFILAFSAAFLFSACGNNAAPTTDKNNTEEADHDHEGHNHGSGDHEGHEHETYYTCEHHPEIHEHSLGKCPKCQMDLIKKEGESHDHEGHQHEAYYTCSVHPGVHEHGAGKCPTCGKDLIKKEGEGH
jgi:Cu(I)/Ag(I) efflux system membrane fusion protein